MKLDFFISPHIKITRIKKRVMTKHLGINDSFLSIDPLKTQTIECLSQVPQKDMFLYLALKNPPSLIFILIHIFIIIIHIRSDAVVQNLFFRIIIHIRSDAVVQNVFCLFFFLLSFEAEFLSKRNMYNEPYR